MAAILFDSGVLYIQYMGFAVARQDGDFKFAERLDGDCFGCGEETDRCEYAL